MSVGQELRAAREEKGMSLGEIARRTNIQSKFLQAIEEDNFAAVPPIHCRFFIRDYARLVGVDADTLLRELPDVSPPAPAKVREEEASSPAASEKSSLPSSRGEYREFMRRLSSGRGMEMSGSNVVNWLIGAAVVLLLVLAGYYFFFRSDDPKTTIDSGASGGPDTAAQVLPRPDGDSTAAGGTEVAPDDSLTLVGRAVDRVWFSIVMDGGRSETGLVDSGTVKTWRAEELFKLTLGNAGGLVLTLEEKELGTLGPLGMAVRNQVIDRNGLRTTGGAGR